LFTVELRQQPSSQGQRAARGRPGAELQLVPLLLFRVALLKNDYLLRLLPYFDKIKTFKTKPNYGSITARLKSLEQFVADSFTVSVTTVNCPEMKIYKKQVVKLMEYFVAGLASLVTVEQVF
jgi:hypothetical protein